MPIVISKKNRFKGTFSNWNSVWEVLKKLQRAKNGQQLKQTLLIGCPSGRVKKSGKTFSRCTQQAFIRELSVQKKIAIFDANGNEYLYSVWLSKMDEIYEP